MQKLFSCFGSISGLLIGGGLTLMMIMGGTGSQGILCELNCEEIVYAPHWTALLFQSGLIIGTFVFFTGFKLEKGKEKILAEAALVALLPSIIAGFFISLFGAIIYVGWELIMLMMSTTTR